ncbi:hypothetical protein KGF57_000211 [Candida theae]|uniref:Uncharacterized protein n=1 Tax=Candida theae TaxID=1198502 RepID=A0AAD5BJB4_9ASCO|nr:uncharacterized protein KGF57_000211 [Candida theae]KAI5968352.1 hypothetical protein KGF57_000211 [Candida theae]
MPSIQTTIIIQAPPELVKDRFFDYAAYPTWNPFMVSFQKYTNTSDPQLNEGDELQIDLKLKGMKHTSTMYPKIISKTESSLVWRGVLVSDWIFYGVHSFTIEPLDGGKRTLFVQSEQFGGFLVYILQLFGVLSKTKESFIEFNEALKDEAEKLIN